MSQTPGGIPVVGAGPLPEQRDEHAALSHEHARLAALAGLDLTMGESLPAVLARIATAADALLPTTLGASVVLWNAAAGTFTRAATTVPGQVAETSAPRVRREAGASRWVVDRREPLIVPDVATEGRIDHNPMVEESGIRAYVGIPITASGLPVGVLYALDDRPREYQLSDIAFLQTLARRASAAIVNSRLMEEIAQARDRAQALAAVADALIAARSLPEILSTVAAAVADAARAGETAIQVVDIRKREVLHEIRHGSAADRAHPTFADLMAGATGEAMDSAATMSGTTSAGGPLVAVPLIFEGRALGAVSAGRGDGDTDFDTEDVDLIEAMAAQASVAIENARLHEATGAALREVEALFQLSRALNNAETTEQLLQEVVDGVARHLPADRVALFGLDVETRTITYACRGGPGQDGIDLSVQIDELLGGLSGWALRHQRPAYSLKGTIDHREDPASQQRRIATEAGSVIAAPLTHRGKSFGTLTVINDLSHRDFSPHDVDVLASMATQAAVAIADAQLFEEVQRLAVTDSLTGIANRGHLFDLAEREYAAAVRYRRPLSVVMVDLDDFKAVNDTYGHGVGDQVLVEVVRRCRAAIRDADLLGRYGGDELLALLPETLEPEANRLAGRLRSLVSAEPVATAAGPVAVSLSAGVASLDKHDMLFQHLVDRADRALLEAKRANHRTA